MLAKSLTCAVVGLDGAIDGLAQAQLLRLGGYEYLDVLAGQQTELPLVERQDHIHPGGHPAGDDDRVVGATSGDTPLGRAS